MLEPQDRRLLLESLQPPENYRLDWAVGTTYSLDLIALLGAPVAFAFSDCQDREGRACMNRLALLKAVRQYADRVLLFCQAGKIAVPGMYQPLLSSLEDSVVQAFAPGGGSFHAKLWFLRYIAEGDSVVYRVLCLSRNMTFDRSWDTVLCLEGELQDRIKAIASNHPLGQFVEALPSMAKRRLNVEWQKRLHQLARDIRKTKLEAPKPFEKMKFHPIGIGGRASSRFPHPQQMLVVSPFVEDGFLADLADCAVPIKLVSRPESLARLSPATLGLLDQVWVLDDAAEPEPGDAEEVFVACEENGQALPAPESDAETPNHSDADIPLVGLHAKLYVVDKGWHAHVFTGSANATSSAFSKNVEFLVELIGKKSRCGVDTILGAAERGRKNRAASLADLLQPYSRMGDATASDPAELAFEWEVERIAQQLAACSPAATCEAKADEDVFQVAIRAAGSPHLERNRLRTRPISLPEPHFREVHLGSEEWVRFENVSFDALTAFFVFELSSDDEYLKRCFVLNIPLVNPPANRRERILRSMLSDPDQVRQFLLLLLSDQGAGHSGVPAPRGGCDPSYAGDLQRLIGGSLLESLVRALDREPERLDQVAQVLEDLQTTEEGRQLLPPDLDVIWQPIWEVRQLLNEPRNRSSMQ